MSRAWRLPALVVLVAVLVAAIVAERNESVAPTGSTAPLAVSMVAEPSAPGSIWYCAAGTATGAATGVAEQSVVIANITDDESSGTVTVVTDGGRQESRPITVPAHGTTTVRTSDVLRAPWAAVVVEATGGGIAVTQELRGPAGRTASDCASSSAAQWWFPSGTSVAGARPTLLLFNPFPGEATVDVEFDTEDGARRPQQLQGYVVRGGQLAVVDVSEIVTLRERVSTSIEVRAGRVVANLIQATDGRNNTVGGLTFLPGSTVTAPIWTFPTSTPAVLASDEIVAIMNTGDTDAEVQVQVQVDDPAANGTVEPFVVSVPARRSLTVDLGSDARIPPGVGRWLLVRASGGEPIVASRSVAVPRTATSGGLGATIGVPIVATRWIGTVAVPSETTTDFLSIVNPDPARVARVTVRLHGSGRVADVDRLVAVAIPPGQRLVVGLARSVTTRPAGPWEVVSDIPVVAGQWFGFASPISLSTLGAYPLSGTFSSTAIVIGPDTPVDVAPAPRTDDTAVAPTTTTTPSTTTTVAVN